MENWYPVRNIQGKTIVFYPDNKKQFLRVKSEEELLELSQNGLVMWDCRLKRRVSINLLFYIK